MDNSIKPYFVVEGRIRGSELPDEWIVVGNHRDAWAFGGVDPSSGTASMVEMTRALGTLLKQGIRPRRTVVVCSWDGEEVGLTGSTEWGEQFADELRQKAVAYINVDSSVSGPDFQGDAVASLAPMLVETTRDVQDPTGVSLHDAWKATAERKAKKSGKKETIQDSDLAETRIGSASDHTVFLNFVGMPVLGLQFDGPYGVYHSMYDNFYWMNHFGDPGYKYHTLMSQLWGMLTLRLANADMLPYDFENYAIQIRDFVGGIGKGNEKGKWDSQPLLNSIAAFESSGRRFNASLRSALDGNSIDPEIRTLVNHSMMQVERNWLNPEGIPGRPWFKHMIYGTRYTYAHLELPGIAEAAETGNWMLAQQQADVLREAVAKNTKVLDELTAELVHARNQQAKP